MTVGAKARHRPSAPPAAAADPPVPTVTPPLRYGARERSAILVAILIATFAGVYSFFMNRSPDYDELILANPIYEYMHGPRMTYPAHSQPDFMVVHPPTHYAIVATFMKLGFGLFHAAGMPIFLLVLLSLALILTGKFSFESKLGLMVGPYLGIFVWGSYRPVRPDLHLTAAWFAGLVALESGRLAGWKVWRLALGAFLLTYASGLHYPGSLAFLGCVVYSIWCGINLGWVRARGPILAMGAAACVFGIPYLVTFVIPFRQEIRSFVIGVETSTFKSAWQLHLDTYGTWWKYPDLQGAFYRWTNRPVTALLTAPLFALRLPAALIGPLLLFFNRSTRGMALAALPYVWFLLFFAGGQGKNSTNTGYYAAEISLYLAALLILISIVVGKVTLSWGERSRSWSPYAAAALVSLPVFIDVPNSMANHRALTKSLNYEDVVRAAGEEIIGPDAVVGTASPVLWYHSGARALYFITPDLLYPEDISTLDLPRYFSHFDAFAISPQTSGVTWNRQHKCLTSWYVDGDLKLRGFVFDAKNLLSHLFVGTQAPATLQGFSYDEPSNRVWRFTEDAGGDTVFLSFIAPLATVAGDPKFRPAAWGSDEYFLPGLQRATLGSDVVEVELMPLRDFDRLQPLLSQFRIVQQVRGKMAVVDPERLVARLEHEPPFQIARTLPEADAARIATALDRVEPAFEAANNSAAVKNGLITVNNAAGQGESEARSQAIPVQPGARYHVSYDLKVSSGGVAVNIMSGDLTKYRHQLIRTYTQSWGREDYVITAEDQNIVVTVSAYSPKGGKSSFQIRDFAIERVTLR